MTTTPKRPLRRALNWLVFWGIPLVMIAVAVWLTRDLAGAVSLRWQEGNSYSQRLSEFEAEATQAALDSAVPAAGQGRILLAGWHNQAQPTAIPAIPDLNLVTNTPLPEIQVTLPAINTPVPIVVTATPPPPVMQLQPFALPTLIFPEDPPADLIASQPTAVPTRITPIPRNHDLVNIVLLGSDQEITADNTLRTDTMIIVSINRDTQTVSLLSLPRDLYVYIPGLGMNRLNVAYGWGQNAGWTGGGFGLFRDTIIYNFGINVHYYAKVGISDLTEVIDLIGGVDLAVECNYQDYALVGVDIPSAAVLTDPEAALWTLPIGYYHMSGGEALWYARSRGNSDDFDRGRRQQQLIRALLRQALNSGQINNIPSLWTQGTQAVETDLPLNNVLSLAPIALSLDNSQIESFTLIAGYHTFPWTAPDGANVQIPDYETLIPLLEDFYTPPSENQVSVSRASVRVTNGTANPNLDRVATERLGIEGFSAFAAGDATTQDYAQTVLIDYTGQTKGSSLFEIADILGVRQADIVNEPSATRDADFEVILGANYNPCESYSVLPAVAATE
jgi:LCP family protein required for cell wall assembly